MDSPQPPTNWQDEPRHRRGPPASGYRIPMGADQPEPSLDDMGQPVAYEADGRSPLFVGSALFENSVQPCKISPTLDTPCRVPYGGAEREHTGRFDLLPFDPEAMEWISASDGRVPRARRPVQGGYEENGEELYHALAEYRGVKVPGKTGEHLDGAHIAFAGGEHKIRYYELLVWR